MKEHKHAGTLLGPLDDHKDGVKFVQYFDALVTSDASESGYVEFLPSGSGWASWKNDAGVKLEWRNNIGDGPINEGRVTFTVNQPLDKIHKYLTNNEFEKREGVKQCIKMGESTNHRRVSYSCDVKRPFQRTNDYLMEDFDCDSSASPGGKLLLSRSIFDDNLVSAKQSKIMGLRRVSLPLRGFLLLDSGSGDKATTVVFICTVNVASVFADISGQVEIPKALRIAVDELLNFSFVYNLGKNPDEMRPSSLLNIFSGYLQRLRSPSGNDIKKVEDRQDPAVTYKISYNKNDEEDFTSSANPIASKASKAGATKSAASRGRAAELRQENRTEVEMGTISASSNGAGMQNALALGRLGRDRSHTGGGAGGRGPGGRFGAVPKNLQNYQSGSEIKITGNDASKRDDFSVAENPIVRKVAGVSGGDSSDDDHLPTGWKTHVDDGGAT